MPDIRNATGEMKCVKMEKNVHKDLIFHSKCKRRIIDKAAA